MIGGLFAMFAKPEQPPEGDFVRTQDGYEVRLADPLDPAYARSRVHAQRDALDRVIARSAGQLCLAATVDDIERSRQQGAFAIVLHMEGADAISADLGGLEAWYSAGLRSLGPVWSRPNIFGHGVPFAFPRSPDTGPGLTEAGRQLVKACNDLGIMVDVSHLNERGFWDVAKLTTAPLVATHACAHAVCRSTRNLTDDQLDAIRESDGVVGFNFSVCDVRTDGHLDEDTPLEAIVQHLAYMAERVGEDHLAFGSDFDGAVMPLPLNDASRLQRLTASMRRQGFSDAALRKIAFENWMRVFRRTWR